MPRLREVVLLSAVILCSAAQAAEGLDLGHVRKLAISFFRDSTEVPMNVDVTTEATDPSGRVRHHSHGTAGMVFNGYNQGAHKFSLRANAGLMSAGAMKDSLSGDLAAFFAGGLLQKEEPNGTVEISQPDRAVVRDKDCAALTLMRRWVFPEHPCGTGVFTLGKNGGGNLTIQRFTFDSAGSPASAKVEYLGDVQVTGFHAEVEFQEKLLPGDTKPYLWPLTSETSLNTDKGKLTITNRYSPKAQH